MSVVLDASAMLAVIFDEPGAEFVADRLGDAHISAVNLSEALAKLIERGVSPSKASLLIQQLGIEIHAFDFQLAEVTAGLRQATRPMGLSLGDRACAALCRQLDLPMLTSDMDLAGAADVIGVEILMIR